MYLLIFINSDDYWLESKLLYGISWVFNRNGHMFVISCLICKICCSSPSAYQFWSILEYFSAAKENWKNETTCKKGHTAIKCYVSVIIP